MSNEIDDAMDFIEASAGAEERSSEDRENKKEASSIPLSLMDEDENIRPGTPNQYALYGPGYTATTPTVGHLKPGAYEITRDNRCIYVVPMPKPSGLLLELPAMRSEAVISIVENFWNSEKDYKEGNDYVVGGAAFKAGVLIYGPPGTGKSCTLKIVCNKLIERSGTVFYAAGHPTTTMEFLGSFAQIEPNRKCIVILEDIDSLINNYGESGFLDMLDSAKTANNTLFIATTNYPDRLDPRIYNRPGRFSHVVKIGYPTPEAREAYLKAILKKHDTVAEIVGGTSGFTIDHLTALVNAVYREKKDLHKEIKRLSTLFKVAQDLDKEMGKGTMGIGMSRD